MKKKKNIFIIIFSVLIITLSTIVISLYDNVREKQIHNQVYTKEVNVDFQYFTLAMAKEMNPDYQILSFDKSVPSNIQKEFSNIFNRNMYNIKQNFLNDKNFKYVFKQGEKVLSNHMDTQFEDDETKYTFYTVGSYDSNGKLQGEGLLNNPLFQDFDILSMLENVYAIDTDYEEEGLISFIDYEFEINLNKVKVNPVTNLSIQYMLPQNIDRNGYVSNIFISYNNFGYLIFSLCACACIFFIYMLFYPVSVVEEVNPFLLVKKWKAEFSFFLLIVSISLGISGYLILAENTMNGIFNGILIDSGIQYAKELLLICNFIILSIVLILISILFFLLKYILVHGIIRYIKEDTLFGSFIKWIKRSFDELFHLDFTQPFYTEVIKVVGINLLVIFFLIAIAPFDIFLACIYSIVLFLYLKRNFDHIQENYKIFLQYTKQLGDGNFDKEINEDLGLFNSLKDEFNKIKVGYKKAVKEETKSQNMKTELISNVSHDLKTPLTCIKNYVYLLKDDNLDKEKREEYIKNLEQYTNRLTTLIEDLFEVSKVNSGNIQLNQTLLNVVDLLNQTLAESEEILSAKNLQVVKAIESEDIQVVLDGDKTFRVFENLLTNIGKYAMPNSRVYIDMHQDEENVYIEFKNISETQMNFNADEITERFVRGDKSRHEVGSGLGLAIAKSFTEVQNGKFKIIIDGDLFKVIICFNKA